MADDMFTFRRLVFLQNGPGFFSIDPKQMVLWVICFLLFTAPANVAKEVNKSMELTSPGFAHQADIPKKYTCDGEDVSPGLVWSGIPAGAKSLALIADDPDAPDPANPRMTWVHWVLYNIPVSSDALPEAAAEQNLPEGTLQGLNDWKRTGYGGPCPPIGKHRYFFKLYALDTVLPDLGEPTKSQLESKMQGHVIDQTDLIGRYQR